MRYLVPALPALLLAGAALSPAFAQPGQACLRQNMVQGWKVVNDQSLIVTDRTNRQFAVSLEKGCRDLKYPMRLGFSNGTGFGLGCIGHHDFLYVPANGGDVSQRCLIADIQPYGPAGASR